MRGGAAVRGFCGRACGAAHELLTREGLGRYYELGGGARRPVTARTAHGRAWVAPLARRIASAEVMRHVALEVRGLHSRGCVWLIEELFRREPGRIDIAVHPALARVELWVARGFDLDRFVSAVERFGYELGPARAGGRARGGGPSVLQRAAPCVCLAVAGGAALIAGPDGERRWNAAAGLVALAGLAALALWRGGAVLLRPSLRDLRRGSIAPELPVSLGLACALGGALASAGSGQLSTARGGAVALLVALAIGERGIEDWLALRSGHGRGDAGDDIVCRRIRGGRVELASCRSIRRGDHLVIAPGELVPVAATWPAASARSGDEGMIAIAALAQEEEEAGAAARMLAPGDAVPPGAWNAGTRSVRVTAAQPFSLAALLAARSGAGAREPGSPHDRAARWVILVAAAAGALLWAGRGRALDVAAAILLASPPAALALAAARRQVEAELRRRGLIVRRPDFLERARAVRLVAVDEIGTLVAAGAELRFPEGVARLSADERAALDHLAAHSRHPRCHAVRRALAATGGAAPVDAAGGPPVREEPCLGVEADIAGRRYRLGAPRWAVERGAAPAAGLGFSRDGRLLVWLVADEELRPDARAEVDALRAHGVEAWLLTADEPGRARAIAAEAGIPRERARGAMQPGDKAAWLAARERQGTLFLGDGLNDGAVGAGALVTGTPSADRPLVAARSDFYLVASGLAPVASALDAARALDAAARRSRRAACASSGAAVVLALAGLATPLAVALCMPLASLAIARAAARSLAPAAASRAGCAHVTPAGARAARRPASVVAAHT
ncbi:MAG TPA: HAD family hydrolase [Kofleriaceae bacterium]|nr:HAD family hydrolase [Kofleriaceae bacterium]